MTDENNCQPDDPARDPSSSTPMESTPAASPSNIAVDEPMPAPAASPSDESPLGSFRRLRLNPKVDEAECKATPSLPPRPAADPPSLSVAAADAPRSADVPGEDRATPEPPAPGGAERSVPAAAPAAAAPLFAPARAASTVELPPLRELDSALEAEIEAAMASGDLDPDALPAIAAEGEPAGAEKPPQELLEAGQHLTGRIQSIHGDSVFLELGYRSPGVVPLRQFVSGKKPEVGQRIEVLVDRVSAEEGLILVNLPKGLRRVSGNWEALAKGQIVECIVNRTNKGGLEVTVGGLRGFLPSSQVDLGFVSDLEPFVGQKLRVEVIEANPKKRNLVVSRRAYLMIERKELEEKFWQTLDVGQTYTGRVKTIKDYGAFVDLGGTDGFLHIGEMSWHRIKHPSEVVKEGQTVDVKVLSLDRDKKKIGLGMKQLAQNPWSTAADRYPANSAVTGKVTRIADFGAFVELEPGLEGLIHVSEIDHKRVRHPSDALKVHQVVTAQVLETDVERKRVSLSLKALIARPEESKPVEEAPAESYKRKRKGPLKGGTGGTAARGLFGNPADYS